MYKKKTILQLRLELDTKKATPEQLFLEANKLAHEYQEEYNSFVTIIDKPKLKEVEHVLSGIPYALKDNISTQGILTTASSNILKDYVPVYDATVVKKLKQAGATLIGKTVLDELAMGGTGTTGHTGVVRNPWNKAHQIGGSSAGSAACVALGIVPFAIGSDTGDSVRKPAAYGGIVGFKPTYGRISRYGLFAFASSLDHIAFFTRNVYDAALVTDCLKGPDEKDMTTLKEDRKRYIDTLTKEIKGKKLFYIKELCDEKNYQQPEDKQVLETIKQFKDLLKKCQELGFEVEEVSIDKKLLEAIYPTYMCISCAEATSNNANLTGISFGIRGEGETVEEQMMNARTQGFSELIKRRFILGSYILQKENQEKLFLNACRIRHKIVDIMNELFKKYDALIAPAAGGGAPKLETTERIKPHHMMLENHLAIGNFGGFPSLSIPTGKVEDLPIGINITGRVEEDDLVLNIAYQIETITGYKNQIAKERKKDV